MADKKQTPADRLKHHIPEDVRQHARAARSEFRSAIESFLPPEFVEHRRAARKHALLSARALLDHAIDRLETKES